MAELNLLHKANVITGSGNATRALQRTCFIGGLYSSIRRTKWLELMLRNIGWERVKHALSKLGLDMVGSSVDK
jgi:hypothetical protein